MAAQALTFFGELSSLAGLWVAGRRLSSCLNVSILHYLFINKDFFFLRMESDDSDTFSWSHGLTSSNKPQRAVVLQSEVKI